MKKLDNIGLIVNCPVNMFCNNQASIKIVVVIEYSSLDMVLNISWYRPILHIGVIPASHLYQQCSTTQVNMGQYGQYFKTKPCSNGQYADLYHQLGWYSFCPTNERPYPWFRIYLVVEKVLDKPFRTSMAKQNVHWTH